MSTYYVATTGNDNAAGTIGAPFLTIQKALNTVAAGDTVYIRGGTYSEHLIIKTTGSQLSPITVQAYGTEVVTVTSGNRRTIRTGGRQHGYIFRNMRLLASYTTYSDGKTYSIDFDKTGTADNEPTGDIWLGSNNYPNGGNDYFVLDNCYIEGAVRFYGSHCQVINSELNGISQWATGIFAGYGSCDHTLIDTNIIHDYTTRGAWLMNYIKYSIARNNTVYGCGRGINFDGAGAREDYNECYNNLIWDYDDNGIQFEQWFNGTCYNNRVLSWSGTGKGTGIEAISYTNTPDGDLRGVDTNSLIFNNVVHHSGRAGIELICTCGWKVYNNTVDENTAPLGYYGGISLTASGGYYSHNNKVKNNIISNCTGYQLWINDPSGGLTNFECDYNLYYNPGGSNIIWMQRTSTAYTLAAWQAATAFDDHSISGTDPLFSDISNHDFTLQAASPALNVGATLAEVLTDIIGTARPQGAAYDIGAYERIVVVQPGGGGGQGGGGGGTPYVPDTRTIFPTFAGLSWDRVKKPIFSTSVQVSASGTEKRASFWSYPRWEFDLQFEILRADAAYQELQNLMGFFLSRRGSFDTFLYRDPDDCSVQHQLIGTGTGTLRTFQLVRTLGGFTEPFKDISGTPTIYLDNVRQTSGWTMSDTGLITFDTAPGSGVVVRADFSYYFRCRFMDDMAEFNQFMHNLWDLQKLQFISVK
jgi:uncharacterized protein (TIGR02217 family)